MLPTQASPPRAQGDLAHPRPAMVAVPSLPEAVDVPGGVPDCSGPITGLVAGRVAFSAVDGPGSRYVLFVQGCQFDCLPCHNPTTIPAHPKRLEATAVDEVVADIADAAPFLSGVTVTGGEPTLQPCFVRELFTQLAGDRRTTRLTRFIDSNGDAPADVWDTLAPVTDGVMIDLKALDDEIHLVLTGRSNARVLAAVRQLAPLGLLYEVRLLLVPGINDSDEQLERTADWLLSVDPAIRVRVNEFRRYGTRACAQDLRTPRRADLVRYRNVLSQAGITDLIVP